MNPTKEIEAKMREVTERFKRKEITAAQACKERREIYERYRKKGKK